MTDDSKRIDRLEELCAHQGTEIESLSELVREQWDRLDGLTRELLQMRERLIEVEETAQGPHENTKPPHY